tara:strand:- start:43 stop:495 length:453 start_codon:yes stop_codon:yes gene_type:complete
MNNSIKIISTNKKASFQYTLLESFEAGISLRGSEVKSIRENKVNIKESYILVRKNEIYIIGMHIGEYSHSGYITHKPLRDRKLLLNKSEINKIIKHIKNVGKTLIPTKIYFKNNHVKVKFSIAKGKKNWDKRMSKKEKDLKRDTDREMKR